jgi:hypothetical protein
MLTIISSLKHPFANSQGTIGKKSVLINSKKKKIQKKRLESRPKFLGK